mmetsp:Transcript_2334/g.5031  ORF Transcript_2334/g.5031 Transcript_2334/m.5031 type:complete len:502 (+) Transcript_2334:185-1690(+)
MNDNHFYQQTDGQHYQYADSTQYQAPPELPPFAEHHQEAGGAFDSNVHYTSRENASFGGSVEEYENEEDSGASDHIPESEGINAKLKTVYKKAPGAPKRFKSSYVHFFTNFVEKKKQQLGPDGLPIKLDIGAVSKECSSVWKNLPDQEKKYWEYVMEKEKEEFNKQKDDYSGPWRIATDKVKKKEPGAPKRSPSAFFLFVNQRRADFKSENPDMPHTEVVKALGKIWTDMPEEEKYPFREEELQLRAKYKAEADQWKKEVKARKKEEKEMKADPKKSGAKRVTTATAAATPYDPTSGHNPGISSSSVASAVEKEAKGGKRKKKDPNAPKRSPPAFFLFVNHHRPQLKLQFPDLAHTELIKMCGQKWEQMSEEEKKPFRDHEQVLREQYHIDVQNYKRKAVTEKEYWNTPSAKKASHSNVDARQHRLSRSQTESQQHQQHDAIVQQQLLIEQQQQLQHEQEQQQQLNYHHGQPQQQHQSSGVIHDVVHGVGVYNQVKYPYMN